MKDFGSQDQSTERTRERLVLIRELVREVSMEIARIRASTAAWEAVNPGEWHRTERAAHNIAARAQALELAVLSSCARELERFAGAIASQDLRDPEAALQGACIALETIDLELASLSRTERSG